MLVVESHWTEQSSTAVRHAANSTKIEPHCWDTESFEIIEPCHLCSEFEVASRSIEACYPTHYKEIIKCHVSGKTQRRYNVFFNSSSLIMQQAIHLQYNNQGLYFM